VGYTGIALSHYCKGVVLTDRAAAIPSLNYNITNTVSCSDRVEVLALEWGKATLSCTEAEGQLRTVDVIVGADLMYESGTMDDLLSCIQAHLHPQGIFYGVTPAIRAGVQQFEQIAESYGFTVTRYTAAPKLINAACGPANDMCPASKRRVAALGNQFGVHLTGTQVPRSLLVQADAPYILFTLRRKITGAAVAAGVAEAVTTAAEVAAAEVTVQAAEVSVLAEVTVPATEVVAAAPAAAEAAAPAAGVTALEPATEGRQR
jgi:hypothetical protein